jgi:prepilin-type N-terminal cleavage/methylation domain-containing protein
MDKINNDKGFTLLEVVFAVSILTVGILAVASMQVASIRGNSYAWSTTEASTVAMGQIETLIDLPYNDAALTAGDHGPVTNGRYNISWRVTNDQLIARTKTIRLTVNWTDYALPRNISMAFTLGEII